MGNDNQLKLLSELSEKLRKELTREKALASLTAAGIVDSKGNLTPRYQNLEKVLERQEG